jgi:hypothetical protein
MKPSLLILTAAAILCAAAAASSLLAAPPSAPASRPHQVVLYGHVKSIAQKNHHFVMRFDPAFWLTGLAAERACGCNPVPNDYDIVDESHRLLTFAVKSDARVTVLTRHGTGAIPATAISVGELARIVKGENPNHRQLTEPKAGFWIRIGDKYPNPVLSLDQQFQP